MKPGRIIGVVFGLAMIVLAVGAYFSGEPASRTEQGRIVTIGVGVMGFLMFLGNLTQTKQKSSKTENQPPAMPISPAEGLLCPTCKRPVSSEHKFCPYCASPLKIKCPSCGRDVKSDFNVCPYCAAPLKKAT